MTITYYRATLQRFLAFYAAVPLEALTTEHIERYVYNLTALSPRSRVRGACQTLEEQALTEPVYFTGLRVSEVRSIRWRDIDLPRRQIVVMGKGRN